MSRPAEVLVVSCYELGHQPVSAAWLLGFLERAGIPARGIDLAVESFDRLEHAVTDPAVRLVVFSVPMHTALVVGSRAAERIRRIAPGVHRCFFGLYATLNADHLLGTLADSVLGGEAEEALIELACQPASARRGRSAEERPAPPVLRRIDFPTPRRDGLPPITRYAQLVHGGETLLAAAIEASRGCLHECRHCPIPPVYGGRFFVVPREVVLEDVRRLVAAGARHVTFADPDFFNGPGHSLALVRAMHAEHPALTFDITTKIEHILRHRARLPELARLGCLFVVSAVESLSDVVLGHLDKGHVRADVFEALSLVRRAGITLRPSLVAFTPWTTIDDYLDVLDWIGREGLVGHVDPVQLSIRLLVPPGSLLAELPAFLPHRRRLAPENFQWSWEHPDDRMDRLHQEVTALVREAARCEEEPAVTFARIRDASSAVAGRAVSPTRFLPARATTAPPRLTEPWFC